MRRARDPNYDAVMRIGSESSEAADPFCATALLAMESIGTSPPRTRHRRPVARDADSAEIVRCCLSDNPPPALVCGTEGDPLRHDAVANEMPQGDEQLARQGDDHLLARTAVVLGASSKPLGQRALLLEFEEAPRELDHRFPDPSVAGSGKPLLAACLAAFVGRAREATVARHSAPVAQVPGQD